VNEHISAVHAYAKGNLVHSTAFALQNRYCLIDAVVGYQTAVYAQKPVAAALDETDFSHALSREADVIAIAPWIVSANRIRDWRLQESSDAAQLLAHDMLLERKLTRVGDMLPLAPATFAKVGARRLHPV
jgi:hypothetical protein